MRRPAWPPLLLLALAVGLLCGHSLLFNFVTDDAFISFVYARNLARHGELVFNLGERVEGYTNFLWTLLLALGLRLGVPAEVAARVLGTLCGAATLVVCALALRRMRAPAPNAPAAAEAPLTPADTLPAFLLAGIPGYACWSSGGLETQLFTLLTTLGAITYLGRPDAPQGAPPRASALWFGLGALTRPEGLLFFALTALHHLLAALRRRRLPFSSRAEWTWIGLFLLLTVPHLIWRRLYYGDFLPNTFYIKTAGVGGAWQQGGYYLLQFARQTKLPLLLLPAALLVVRGGPGRRLCLYALTLTAPFLLYVASVGGDFMGLHRFLMPIVPIWVLAGSAGILALLSRLPLAARLSAVAALLGLHGLNTWAVDRHALTFIGADRGIDTPGYLRHYTADRAAIGKWLGQHVQPDDYQVVGGAGAQVYYAGIRALDSFGLSDWYVAHKVPAVSSRPGHQKFAPLAYVLSRNPTILTYNVYRIEDAPYAPPAAEAFFWRQRGFHFVSVQVPGLSKPWYTFLKRLDRRLGPLPPADDID